MREKIIVLVLSLMLCLIPGCGCNDDDDGGDGYFPIDTTPPVITLVFPEDGVGDVAVNTSISATFSEGMDPASINDSTFTVSGATGAVTYDADSKTALFTPSADLSYSTPYTATISTDAKDLSGNALESDYTWTFTTGIETDTTAPSVTSTSPSDAETDVAVNTSISATFSEEMNPVSINDSTFTVSGVAGSVTYEASTMTATFQPSEFLAYDTTYTATITTGAEDMAHNPLEVDKIWTFTTITPALQRLNGDTLAYHENPVVVFNDDGDGLALWIADSHTNSEEGEKILCSFYDHLTGEWSPEGDVVTEADRPDVASNDSDFMIVYRRSNRIYARSYVYNGIAWEWGSEEELHSIGGTTYDPRIASNGTGYCAVWSRYLSGTSSIYTNIHNGTSWTGDTLIESSTGYAQHPEVASNGTGYAIVWRQHDGDFYSVYANIYNGSWGGTATILEGADNDAHYPQIASNGAGYAVAWHQYDGVHTNIYANIYNGSWGVTATTLEGIDNNAYYPQIASNGAGYAVAWYQNDGSYYNIYVNRYDGAVWLPTPEEIDNGDTNDYHPKIASNSAGYAVTWYQYSGGHNNIYANIYDSGWQSPDLIETGDGDINYPNIASKGSGYAVTWPQFDDSENSNIYANLCSYNDPDWVWEGEESLIQAPSAHRGSSTNPRMATNIDGTTLAVWEQYNNGTRSVHGSIYNIASASWGASFMISDYGRDPDVATNGSGFMVVYRKYSSIYAKSYDGQSWYDEEVIEDGTGSAHLPTIASNGVGYMAAWFQYDVSSRNIYANIYDGSAWQAAADSLDSGDEYVSDPQIASNGTGYAVTWQQSDGSDERVYVNIHDGASWGGDVPIDESANTNDAYNPQIASNGAGYGVTWEQSDDTYRTIYANLYDGAVWQGVITVDTLDSYAFNPRIASNGAGYGITWYQWSGADSIFARIYTGAIWGDAEKIENFSDFAYNPTIGSNGDGYGVSWMQYNGSSRYDLYSNTYSGGAWGTDPALMEDNDGDVPWVYSYISSDGTNYIGIWSQYDSDNFVADIYAIPFKP